MIFIQYNTWSFYDIFFLLKRMNYFIFFLLLLFCLLCQINKNRFQFISLKFVKLIQEMKLHLSINPIFQFIKVFIHKKFSFYQLLL
jgi:hypothetical protein